MISIFLAALLLTPQAVAPSFNCRLAESQAEHAICADPELARLDRRMADAYREARARLSPQARDALVRDQRWFVGARDEWFENRQRWEGFPTLSQRMTERTVFLEALGRGGQGWIGQWRNAAGVVDIVEWKGKLVVSLNAANPTNARWLCDTGFSGVPRGNSLSGAVRDEEGRHLTARLSGDVITIEEQLADGLSSSPGYCGANGFVTGGYFRVGDTGNQGALTAP